MFSRNGGLANEERVAVVDKEQRLRYVNKDNVDKNSNQAINILNPGGGSQSNGADGQMSVNSSKIMNYNLIMPKIQPLETVQDEKSYRAQNDKSH